MLKKFAFLSLLSVVLGNAASAGEQIIVNETFEGYSDYNQLLGAWPSNVPARPDNATRLIEGDTEGFYGGTNMSQYAQFCNAVEGAAGIATCDLATDNAGVVGGATVNYWNLDTPMLPTATQKIVFSADIGDDGLSANKRITVGLRDNTTPSNLVEMGFYNGGGHFSFRTVLFGTGSESPGEGGWTNFVTGESVDEPLPTVLNASWKIGPAFHRFTAEITLTEITIGLDLYADGFRNYTEDPENPGEYIKTSPGTGIAGMYDAVATYANTLNPAGIGFDQIRFGGPSGVTSGTAVETVFAAFDNILLKYVDIEAPLYDADFDNDGDVDGRDFLLWQRTGLLDDSTASNGDGDANGDGNVDSADLAAWSSEYRRLNNPSVAGLTTVPEPTSAALLGLALSSLVLMKRR